MDNLAYESYVDSILGGIENFLRKNKIYLVDKKDEITFLIQENLDGKSRDNIENAIRKAVKIDAKNLEKVYDIVLEEMKDKKILIPEAKKIELYFSLKKVSAEASKYLERELVAI